VRESVIYLWLHMGVVNMFLHYAFCVVFNISIFLVCCCLVRVQDHFHVANVVGSVLLVGRMDFGVFCFLFNFLPITLALTLLSFFFLFLFVLFYFSVVVPVPALRDQTRKNELRKKKTKATQFLSLFLFLFSTFPFVCFEFCVRVARTPCTGVL